MDKVRIGIIGVGNIGSAHAESIAQERIPELTLGALCDNDSKRAAELKDRYPRIPIFTDAEAMMDSGLVDAVVISTPHYEHPTLAILAFGKGLHVLTEKPAGVYCAKVREMVAAAKDSGKVFAIMFNQRTNGLFRKARELVQDGALGELKRSVWIVTNWYRKQAYYDSGSWRATWSGEGGGVLMNQAPHNLDLWQWICGMPVEVRAQCDLGKYHDIEVEDDATIFVRYKNGATGVFITTTGEYPGTNRLEISGTKGKIVLEGGGLVWTRLDRDEESFRRTSEREKNSRTVETFTDEPHNGHEQILGNFGRAILYGEPLIARGEEGLAELTLCNAAYLSSWQDRPVTLPMDDDLFYAELQGKIRQGRHSHKIDGTHTEIGSYHARWNTTW